MLLRRGAWPSFRLRSLSWQFRAPGMWAHRLSPALPSLVLEAAYSLSPSAPGAVGADLWQPLVLGCPQLPREGQGLSSRWGGHSSALQLDFGRFASPSHRGPCQGGGSGCWEPSSWPEEFLGLSLIAIRMAGQVTAAVSCSSLAARVCFPLFGSLLALTCLPQLRWLWLCRVNALPGSLIKRREDVFQKSLASSSAWSELLSWWRGEEASTAFS